MTNSKAQSTGRTTNRLGSTRDVWLACRGHRRELARTYLAHFLDLQKSRRECCEAEKSGYTESIKIVLKKLWEQCPLIPQPQEKKAKGGVS